MTNFSDGMVGILSDLVNLDIIPGSNSFGFCTKRDKTTIHQMNRKEVSSVKHQQKQRLVIRKGFGNQDEEK